MPDTVAQCVVDLPNSKMGLLTWLVSRHILVNRSPAFTFICLKSTTFSHLTKFKVAAKVLDEGSDSSAGEMRTRVSVGIIKSTTHLRERNLARNKLIFSPSFCRLPPGRLTVVDVKSADLSPAFRARRGGGLRLGQRGAFLQPSTLFLILSLTESSVATGYA